MRYVYFNNTIIIIRCQELFVRCRLHWCDGLTILFDSSYCGAKNSRGTVIVSPTLAVPICIGTLTSFILQLLYVADTSGAPEQR